MTAPATLDTAPAPPRPRRQGKAAPLAVAALGGVVLGVGARLWMRTVATEPAFSWGGTAFIVGAFAVCATAQAVASRLAWRRRLGGAARVLAGVSLLPLCSGAGVLMAPTIVFGGLAVWRRHWWVRAPAAVLAVVPVVGVWRTVVNDFGLSVGTVLRCLGLLAVYGTLLRVVRPTFARRRP